MVEVNEEGSEATAATAFMLFGGSRYVPIIKPFIADHPFLFFIIDKWIDVVLFSGHLVKPSTVTPFQQDQN